MIKSFKQSINKQLYLLLYKENFFLIENQLFSEQIKSSGKRTRCFKNFFKLNFNLQKKLKIQYPAQLAFFNSNDELFKVLTNKKLLGISYLRLFYFEFFNSFFLVYLFEIGKVLKNLKFFLLRSIIFSAVLKISE